MSNGGGVGGKGVLAVVPLEQDAAAAHQRGARTGVVPFFVDHPSVAVVFDCHQCHQPLRPPIFLCDALHLMCSTCRGVHGEACGLPVARSAITEAILTVFKVPCDYQVHGCDVGLVIFHDAAEHRRACQYAPCTCPERFPVCGFSGSRRQLLDHIVADHERHLIHIRLGQPGDFSLPLSQRWHVLVADAEEHQASGQQPEVFLVSLGERSAGWNTMVWLVCVRAPDDGTSSRNFSCTLSVKHPGYGTRHTFEWSLMTSSSLSGGSPRPREVESLRVPQEYLSGDIVPLTVQIDLLQLQPPPSPLVALAPPSPAAAADAKNNRIATPGQGNGIKRGRKGVP